MNDSDMRDGSKDNLRPQSSNQDQTVPLAAAESVKVEPFTLRFSEENEYTSATTSKAGRGL